VSRVSIEQQNRMHYQDVVKVRRAVDRGQATEEQKIKADERLGSGGYRVHMQAISVSVQTHWTVLELGGG